jgi:hypothetical protein
MVVEGATLVGPGSRGLERAPRSTMIVAWDVMTAGVNRSTPQADGPK